MGKVIALVNQKGGVSKTVSTINIGGGLARKGKKVLLIDFDSQGSMSLACGIQSYKQKSTIYEVLKGDCSIKEAIVHCNHFDVVPSDLRLAKTDGEIANEPGREQFLKEAIEPIKNDYDFILIDCSPSLGILTNNALTSCDFVLIPTISDFLPMIGISQLFMTISTIQRRLNPKIKVLGIFVSMYDSRANITKEIEGMLQKQFAQFMLQSKIRKNVALSEATTIGKDIFEYDSNSNGAIDYSNLVDEILEKLSRI